MTGGAGALELDGVSKTFTPRYGDPVEAVRGIDLHVPAGQVVAFLGPNGAGKTTALDMVLGLTEPSHGTVRVCGTQPRRAVQEGRVGAVLQSGGLLPDIRVGETVRLIASTYRRPLAADEAMRQAGIEHLAGRRVGACSGGEQQRLRFALALLPDPDLLVLDEPTAGMDVTARREFWAAMHEQARAGRTIVFATHDLQEADSFAERIVMIARGRVVADGSTEELRSRTSGRTVSARVPDGAGEAWFDTVARCPGAAGVHRDGGRVHVRCTDSDAVARALLVDLGARDLEIASGSLESAFVALTGGEQESLEVA